MTSKRPLNKKLFKQINQIHRIKAGSNPATPTKLFSYQSCINGLFQKRRLLVESECSYCPVSLHVRITAYAHEITHINYC